MMTKKKTNILLVDNPIDIMAMLFSIVAIGALLSLRSRYIGSTEFPTIASDSLILIFKGTTALIALIFVRLLFHTKKANRTPIFANMTTTKNLFDYAFAVVSYFGIQIIVLIISQAPIFQVASVDVYLFFFSAAICEELLYRGFLVMAVQMALVTLFKIKPKREIDVLGINIFTCFLSGLIFMLVHTTYWGDPTLMILTFLGGVSQAAWYIKSKNLFVPMIAHAAINWRASGTLIQTLNG